MAFGNNSATIISLDPPDTPAQEERLNFANGFNQSS